MHHFLYLLVVVSADKHMFKVVFRLSELKTPFVESYLLAVLEQLFNANKLRAEVSLRVEQIQSLRDMVRRSSMARPWPFISFCDYLFVGVCSGAHLLDKLHIDLVLQLVLIIVNCDTEGHIDLRLVGFWRLKRHHLLLLKQLVFRGVTTALWNILLRFGLV